VRELIRGRGGADAERAIAACAGVAAALHRSSIPVGATRTLAGEIDAVRASVDAVAPMTPPLAATLHRSLDTVGDLVGDAPLPYGVAHGDFDHSQVLFDGPNTSLVDFDTMCLAEPALDLGQFTARLAVSARSAARDAGEPDRGGGGDLEAAFCREYARRSGTGDPEMLLARTAAYRTLTLTRLAVQSWCRLKPERLRPVLALLDARQRVRVP
jgi:aminoglycoside phosphotransferase (APT) family kinase protein